MSSIAETQARRAVVARRLAALQAQVARIESRPSSDPMMAVTEPVALAALRRQTEKMAALLTQIDAQIGGVA